MKLLLIGLKTNRPVWSLANSSFQKTLKPQDQKGYMKTIRSEAGRNELCNRRQTLSTLGPLPCIKSRLNGFLQGKHTLPEDPGFQPEPRGPWVGKGCLSRAISTYLSPVSHVCHPGRHVPLSDILTFSPVWASFFPCLHSPGITI